MGRASLLDPTSLERMTILFQPIDDPRRKASPTGSLTTPLLTKDAAACTIYFGLERWVFDGRDSPEVNRSPKQRLERLRESQVSHRHTRFVLSQVDYVVEVARFGINSAQGGRAEQVEAPNVGRSAEGRNLLQSVPDDRVHRLLVPSAPLSTRPRVLAGLGRTPNAPARHPGAYGTRRGPWRAANPGGFGARSPVDSPYPDPFRCSRRPQPILAGRTGTHDSRPAHASYPTARRSVGCLRRTST